MSNVPFLSLRSPFPVVPIAARPLLSLCIAARSLRSPFPVVALLDVWRDEILPNIISRTTGRVSSDLVSSMTPWECITCVSSLPVRHGACVCIHALVHVLRPHMQARVCSMVACVLWSHVYYGDVYRCGYVCSMVTCAGDWYCPGKTEPETWKRSGEEQQVQPRHSSVLYRCRRPPRWLRGVIP